MKHGPFTIDPVMTGDFRLDGGAMFGVVPRTLWSRGNPPDEHNRIAMTMRALLVRTAERTILVDTGVGNKNPDKFAQIFALDFGQYTLESSLAAHGVAPEDVTDVILTHLHFDHVGGAVRRDDGRLALAFPNAVHYVQRRQWEWALAPSDRDKASYLPDNYLPLRDAEKLALLDGDTELFPGIALHVVDGHTFGQQLVRVTHEGRSVLYCADLVPMSAHIPAPYIMGYDLQPVVTLNEKKRLLDDAAANGDVLVFEHDPGVEAAVVTKDERGYRATATGGIHELLAAGKDA
jgi:glyoxylase-like metal-dependent hydrolase (beta-lactamase superfamily II)